MKYNTAEVASLRPDYLGFIFYDRSPRFFDHEIPKLPSGIKRTGVFVDASLEDISEKIRQYNLDVIQLHGKESASYCAKLKASENIELWKVFSIKDVFDFEVLRPYEKIADMFLFDTKGKEKGGNGYTFDWGVLKNYPSKKPFVLSGGIGLEEIDALKEVLKTDLPIHAIDVNSKFENEPGLKNITDLQRFLKELNNTEYRNYEV